jgi:hypothetical protein
MALVDPIKSCKGQPEGAMNEAFTARLDRQGKSLSNNS